MVRIIVLFLVCFISTSCLSQKQDRMWIFGDHGGIDFRDTSNVVTFYSALNGYNTAATFSSIADNNGDLLFYVAADQLLQLGINVFNKNGLLMFNGEGLQGHPAQSQGLVILPFPGDSSHYYIFHKNQNNSKNYIYYSIVDMNLENGLGAIVSKNIVIHTDSLTQRTTAVKHANGRDWWLVQQRWDQDEYITFLITPDGILGPYKQSTNNPLPKEEFYGTSRFSRSGNRLVSVGHYGNINIMNFDRCTGTISNYLRIGENVFSNENAYLGCEFSPNENVLYVSNIYPNPGKFVYQYDLTAIDIKGSKQTIKMYPDTGLLSYIQLGHMLLGADDKIYVCKGNGSGPNSNTVYTQNIDVILNPDVVGQGCNYSSNFLYLNGGRTTYGLPNMVNYSLGPIAGTICDSLSTGVSDLSKKNNPFIISPNPITNWINIYQMEDFTGGNSYHSILYNSQGQLIFEREMNVGVHTIPTSSLMTGVYFLQLKTSEGIFSTRVTKIE